MKVIFDTNFWSYLATSGSQKGFERLEQELGFQVLLPPSVLLEVANTSDPSLREKILNAMVSRKRKKMRTEVDLESEELIKEVRRLRPNLRRIVEKKKRVNELRSYWTERIWQECLEDHNKFHHKVKNVQNDGKAELFNQHQKKQKENLNEWDVNKTKPSKIHVRFEKKEPHLMGLVDFEKSYEPWRVDCLYYYQNWLQMSDLPLNHNDRTCVDWCESSINITDFLKDKPGYFSFWLEEVASDRMPRNWMRWAMGLLQPLRKLGRGNPQDHQHSSYLIDADIFFTSDRRYFSSLQTIYNDGMVRMAKPCLLSAGTEKFLDEIESEVRS